MNGSEKKLLLSSKMEKRRRLVMIPLVLVVSSLIVSAIVFNLVAKYSPPKHDITALEGIPKPDESYLYGTIVTQYGYGMAMAANLYQQSNGDVNVYFTNSIANSVYLRFDIVDRDNDKVLYKSGYIKPGEYIEAVNNPKVKNEHYNVIVKVYAYTPDSFVSKGTTELALMIQPW